MTFDYVRPSSTHLTMPRVEMISIGTATYMRPIGQSWMKVPTMPGEEPRDPAEQMRALARNPQGGTVTDLGMRSVGGETLHAYRLRENGSESTLYIGADGYPHRLESGASTNTVTFSKFNAIAPIRAPI